MTGHSLCVMIFQHTVQFSVSVYNLLPYQQFNCCADSDLPCKHNYALANRHFRANSFQNNKQSQNIVGCWLRN